MPELRKSVALLVVVACGLLAACSSGASAPEAAPYAVGSNPPRPADCAPPPPADPTTRAGWVGQVAAHPDTVSFVVDDGRGHVVSHGPDVEMPLASATKVVHLAAYGRAVAEGRIRPDERVSLGEWESWYLPGTDGNAHPPALDRLGVPRAGLLAADPARTVTVDEMVSAMIQESDNAATDWLRNRLGDEALTRAAAESGWGAYDLPSELGAAILLVTPDAGPPLEAPRSARGPVEVALARRYAADPAYRADVQRRLVEFVTTDVEGYLVANEAWADATATGTARQLATIHHALASGAYGPGSDLARRQLEYRPPSPKYGAVGFKGGSLTGVLTFGSAARRPDGVATAVVLARRLPGRSVMPYLAGQQAMALEATADPKDFAALVCVA